MAKNSEKKFNIYEAVTERILAQLENGVIPWEKPWTGLRTGAHNRITGKPYSILNQMMLSRKGEYASFKQWSNLGGKIKKGAKSEMVVFWKMLPVTETNDEGEEITKTIPMLRYYNVFHIDDVEGVEPKTGKLRKFEGVKVADDLASAYVNREKITLIHENGDRAFYRPSTDSVTVPLREQFKDVAEYYSTLFHELIHSTGSAERCDRVGERTAEAFFGNEEYSKEELVAELGAAGILNDLGLETKRSIKNSAAYCQSWIKPLKNDKRFIVSASSRAEKAMKFLYGDFDFEQYSEDYEEPKAEKPKAEKPKKTTKKKAETKKAETVKAEPKKAGKAKKVETVKPVTKKAEGKKTETKKGRTRKLTELSAEAKENIKGGYKFIVGGYKAEWKKNKSVELPTRKELAGDLYDAVTRNLYKDGKEIGKKAEEMMKVFRKDAIVAEIERLLKADKTAKKLFATT